nr:MAG: transcription antitermination factor NusB [Pseudomonadota bacterium]
MKSARRRAREYALQGLYQWQLAGATASEIERTLAEDEAFTEADHDYFLHLLRGTIRHADTLLEQLKPVLDRPAEALSPVERAILMLATFEFMHSPEAPYRVVINEAIELAKTFGGTDGHKYVNGVLDKLAPVLRPHEKGASRPKGQAS